MKKRLLNNLVWFMVGGFFLSTLPLQAATRPTFMILNNGVHFADEAERLEMAGARVRQRIPPQILVADLPESMDPRKISTVKISYQNAISLEDLRPLGDMAMAAGINWNRQLLTQSRMAGVQSLGTMRAQIAQKSLPAPSQLTLAVSQPALRVSWRPGEGSLYYEVEASLDSNFRKRLVHTRTNLATTDLPLPEGTTPVTMYVRVRAVDHLETDDQAADDILGGWSNPASLIVTPVPPDAQLAAPTLTSPLDNTTTTGFTLILEWMGGNTSFSRVQVSRSPDFKTTLFDNIAKDNQFICSAPALHLDDVLYWRVQTTGAATGQWTAPRKITVGPPHHAQSDMFVNPEAPK